jgi:hypothetical protein
MKSTNINLRFLKFRGTQTAKFFKELPIPYLIILLLIAGIAFYVIHALLEKPAGTILYATLLTATVALVHLRRRDYHFVCMVDEHPWRVFFIDYLLFTTPLLLPLICRGQVIAIAAIVAAYAAISRIQQPYRKTTKGFPVPSFIPTKAFEVRTLIRRKGWLLALFYLAACAGLPLPYASFIPLWLCIAVLFEGLRDCEPKALLNVYELPPKQFLHDKIRLTVGLYCLATAPICLIYTLLHPTHWPLALTFLTLAALNVMLFITSKYALYEPGRKIVSGQISISLSLIAIFVPLLTPLTLFLLIRYYLMAQKTLTPYLYAYN